MRDACTNATVCAAIASTLTATELCWSEQIQVQAQTADGLLGTQAGVPGWIAVSKYTYNTTILGSSNDIVMV